MEIYNKSKKCLFNIELLKKYTNSIICINNLNQILKNHDCKFKWELFFLLKNLKEILKIFHKSFEDIEFIEKFESPDFVLKFIGNDEIVGIEITNLMSTKRCEIEKYCNDYLQRLDKMKRIKEINYSLDNLNNRYTISCGADLIVEKYENNKNYNDVTRNLKKHFEKYNQYKLNIHNRHQCNVKNIKIIYILYKDTFTNDDHIEYQNIISWLNQFKIDKKYVILCNLYL